MEINKITNQNFKGAFILKPRTQQIRESIPNIIKKGRQIFHDIQNKGDVVLVTRDNYDRKVVNYIEQEGIDFIYYPQISTMSGLDDQEPLKLKKMLHIYSSYDIIYA